MLAGGSPRWAFEAASTSPVPASDTSHDRAETSGTSGASRCGLTCVPDRYSSDGRGTVAPEATASPGAPGCPGSVSAGAAAAAGPRARAPATQNAQAADAAREENPIVI